MEKLPEERVSYQFETFTKSDNFKQKIQTIEYEECMNEFSS